MNESPNDFRNIVAFKDDDAVRKALGRAADEIDKLHTLHLERTKLTTKMIDERGEAYDALEQAQKNVKLLEGVLADKMFDDCKRLTAEVTRMDKRTRHLLNRIEDAEAALLCHDPAYQDEYWKRYPESERGKFTASSSQDQEDIDKLGAAIAFAESVDTLPRCEHGTALKDYDGQLLHPSCGCRLTADDSKQDHSWVNQGICCSRHATPIQRATTMLVCPECGDKRCPKAADCGATCADSIQGQDDA